jgi:hypothetical protein
MLILDQFYDVRQNLEFVKNVIDWIYEIEKLFLIELQFELLLHKRFENLELSLQ